VDKKTQRPTNALGSVLAIEKTEERRLKVKCRKQATGQTLPTGVKKDLLSQNLLKTLMLWSAWAIFPRYLYHTVASRLHTLRSWT